MIPDRLACRQPELAPLLAERAEAFGYRPGGSVSWSGTCRMEAAADGVLAVNLPRQEDRDAVPAWLAGRAIAECTVGELLERAALLGLAVAAVGPTPRNPVPCRFHGTAGLRSRRSGAPLVVDISALWAGPLCGRLLAEAGARVIKVEDRQRPDGTRLGSPEFDTRLNGMKEHRVVDLAAELPGLLADADVVVDSSRPRAMRQLGLDPERLVAELGLVWVSITGYGRGSNRVAFGDDAAVAGGLWEPDPAGGLPHFVGDATADPTAGFVAARAASSCLEAGEARLVEVTMRDAVAALFA